MTPSCPVYLAVGVTDLRNNIDGLAIMVEKFFKLDPFSQSLFVFCNRKRNKIKILFWDKNGFWLDLCQYLRHKKLNFFLSASIIQRELLLKLSELHLQPVVVSCN